MFLCMYICLFMTVCIGCMSRIDVICSRASRNRRSSFDNREIKLFKFYKVEDHEHLFGEGKCSLTYLCPIHMIIHFPHYIIKT
jgi:hypothetical protein